MTQLDAISLIKLELLLDSRIRIEQVNLFKLKFNLLITLIIIKLTSFVIAQLVARAKLYYYC